MYFFFQFFIFTYLLNYLLNKTLNDVNISFSFFISLSFAAHRIIQIKHSKVQKWVFYRRPDQFEGLSLDFVFSCNVGVRQSEKFSPFLFLLYINDLEKFLINKCNQTYIVQRMNCFCILNYMYVFFFKLAIVSFSPKHLMIYQNALNEFFLYCEQWKLTLI